MKVAVLNIKGEETGREINLDKSIFGIEPNEHAVYLDVKNYLANQRQGNAKTKERGEIVGSTRKIKKQKGTGTARAGSIKSPIFRGGGTIFGPKQRDYGFKLNKKVKKLARKSVLSSRAKEKAIQILEDFTFEAPKTKEFISILNSLSVSDKKSLLLVSDKNKNVFLSSRNLKKAHVSTVDEVNTYDLINAERVIICEGTLEQLKERFN
ncbi:LSU ribosomal protein L4P [Ekhidna lutea]|uniref:Large ribosomal subunit protein uL4 n=1 Tax=Ekhidna lutea TaxID=447679 RepID=A0A239JB26_EKHLU|nr:50S ribosomal protein L4 [Ekhidna lutea]SNT03216.1 LSU ribosomal protein L4P [Ekhidna lutea]